MMGGANWAKVFQPVEQIYIWILLLTQIFDETGAVEVEEFANYAMRRQWWRIGTPEIGNGGNWRQWLQASEIHIHYWTKRRTVSWSKSARGQGKLLLVGARGVKRGPAFSFWNSRRPGLFLATWPPTEAPFPLSGAVLVSALTRAENAQGQRHAVAIVAMPGRNSQCFSWLQLSALHGVALEPPTLRNKCTGLPYLCPCYPLRYPHERGWDIAGRVTPRPLPNSSLVCLLLESFVDFAFPMASIEAMLRQRGAPSASDIDRGASNVHWNRSQVWACLDIFMRLSKALTRPSYRGSGLSYTPILPLYLTREFISQSGSLVTRTTDRREVIIPASWKLGTISWRSLQRFQCKFTVGLPLPIPLLV